MTKLIESIIKREGGSRITLGTTNYHFKPDAAGRHVAEVSNDAHAARLLEIKEGFREAAPLADPDNVTASAPPATNTIATAPKPAVEFPAEGNGSGSKPDTDTGDTDKDAAVAAYIERFGKKPHHAWTAEIINAKIAEAVAADKAKG